eukprot:CAMPEP_0197865132 /NCGR_PEP_ID=MMETSP1438-20131217/43486_1 /TAXON_ID=1461541 /ORGANISM="Pterosperma sp., Strain CCMP1384" /LENGTH=778 /DNA_ID=CAMNT_0043483549 /DNA_START=624 /DNA_END=2960 /DNA_ORIENTATION=-
MFSRFKKAGPIAVVGLLKGLERLPPVMDIPDRASKNYGEWMTAEQVIDMVKPEASVVDTSMERLVTKHNAGPKASVGVIELQGGGSYTLSDLTKSQLANGQKNNPVGEGHSIGPNPPGPDIETSLDIQMVSAVADGATLWYWNEQQWLYSWATAFLSAKSTPDVSSLSYGWSELDQCSIAGCSNSEQYVKRVNAEFLKISGTGKTLVVSSGDSGSTGRTNPTCSESNKEPIRPAFPGSSPCVLSVGATAFDSAGSPAAPVDRENHPVDSAPEGPSKEVIDLQGELIKARAETSKLSTALTTSESRNKRLQAQLDASEEIAQEKTLRIKDLEEKLDKSLAKLKELPTAEAVTEMQTQIAKLEESKATTEQAALQREEILAQSGADQSAQLQSMLEKAESKASRVEELEEQTQRQTAEMLSDAIPGKDLQTGDATGPRTTTEQHAGVVGHGGVVGPPLSKPLPLTREQVSTGISKVITTFGPEHQKLYGGWGPLLEEMKELNVQKELAKEVLTNLDAKMKGCQSAGFIHGDKANRRIIKLSSAKQNRVQCENIMHEVALSLKVKGLGPIELFFVPREESAGKFEGKIGFTMRWLTCSFSDLLQNRWESQGGAPLTEVCAVLRRVLDHMMELEKENIVHRDIKAANVYLDLQGGLLTGEVEDVVLGDLGAAELCHPLTKMPMSNLYCNLFHATRTYHCHMGAQWQTLAAQGGGGWDGKDWKQWVKTGPVLDLGGFGAMVLEDVVGRVSDLNDQARLIDVARQCFKKESTASSIATLLQELQ